jgi:putative component of membrane protein insertase Oxa1/YidC/SpoIIIJ protein YidD
VPFAAADVPDAVAEGARLVQRLLAPRAMKDGALAAVRGYQYALRPMLGAQLPLLSELLRLRQGSDRAPRRVARIVARTRGVCRCHPYHPGGSTRFPERAAARAHFRRR